MSMIVREHYKTRTDDEAIDVDGTPYTYTETDKLVTDNFDIETASPEQLRERLLDTETAAKILLGEAAP